MDHARDVTARRGAPHKRVDRFARGDIDRRGVDVEASVGKHLGGRIGVCLVEVGEHDMFPGADPAGNRLADLPRPDNHRDLSHQAHLFVLAAPKGRSSPPRPRRTPGDARF